MKVYGLTKLGKKVTRSGQGDPDEMKILNYVRDMGSVTEEQLEVAGERWMVRKLTNDHLLKELDGEGK